MSFARSRTKPGAIKPEALCGKEKNGKVHPSRQSVTAIRSPPSQGVMRFFSWIRIKRACIILLLFDLDVRTPYKCQACKVLRASQGTPRNLERTSTKVITLKRHSGALKAIHREQAGEIFLFLCWSKVCLLSFI